MNNKLLIVLGIAAVVALLGPVGSMDYTDAVREQLTYCDNVAAKVWPDYKSSHKEQCTSEKLKEYQEILR